MHLRFQHYKEVKCHKQNILEYTLNYLPRSLLNFLSYVLTCQHALCALVLTCKHVLLVYMFTCQRDWHALVLTY